MESRLVSIGNWTLLASEIVAYQYQQKETGANPYVHVLLQSGAEIEGFCSEIILQTIVQALRER